MRAACADSQVGRDLTDAAAVVLSDESVHLVDHTWLADEAGASGARFVEAAGSWVGLESLVPVAHSGLAEGVHAVDASQCSPDVHRRFILGCHEPDDDSLVCLGLFATLEHVAGKSLQMSACTKSHKHYEGTH